MSAPVKSTSGATIFIMYAPRKFAPRSLANRKSAPVKFCDEERGIFPSVRRRERSRFERSTRSPSESSVVTHAQSQVLAELLRDVNFDQIVTTELLRRAAVELAPSIRFRGVQFRARRSGEDDAGGGRGGETERGRAGRGDVVGGSTRLHARATALNARDRGEGDGSDRAHRVRALSAASSARGDVAGVRRERRGTDEDGTRREA